MPRQYIAQNTKTLNTMWVLAFSAVGLRQSEATVVRERSTGAVRLIHLAFLSTGGSATTHVQICYFSAESQVFLAPQAASRVHTDGAADCHLHHADSYAHRHSEHAEFAQPGE